MANVSLYQTCTYPECGYTAEWVTNVHCQSQHNMSRKEVEAQFGEIVDKEKYTKED